MLTKGRKYSTMGLAMFGCAFHLYGTNRSIFYFFCQHGNIYPAVQVCKRYLIARDVLSGSARSFSSAYRILSRSNKPSAYGMRQTNDRVGKIASRMYNCRYNNHVNPKTWITQHITLSQFPFAYINGTNSKSELDNHLFYSTPTLFNYVTLYYFLHQIICHYKLIIIGECI